MLCPFIAITFCVSYLPCFNLRSRPENATNKKTALTHIDFANPEKNKIELHNQGSNWLTVLRAEKRGREGITG